MRALGLDGFSKGWVAVLLDGDLHEITFCRDIADALSAGFDRAAIDIPIGMADDGERACDLLARERLRPHSSRVFTGARRWLWPEFCDPDDANIEMRCAAARSGCRASSGISGRRSWRWIRSCARNRLRDIREAHPELVFLRLNAGRPLPSKKSEAGD